MCTRGTRGLRLRAPAASGQGGRCARGSGGGPGRSAGRPRLPASAPAPAPAPAPGPAPVSLGGACPSAQRPQPMAPSRLQLGLRAAYSGLSSVAGFSIFLVWTVVYNQPATAAMGGLAGTPGRRGALGAGLRAGRRAGGCREALSAVPDAPPRGAGGLFTQNIHWQRRPRAARAFSGCHRDLMPAEPWR